MRLTALARQRPLGSFFALACGISWGVTLIVLAASHFDLVELSPLDTGLIFVSMLLGPSVAGLVLTALLEGRPGLRRLGASLRNWHAGIRWQHRTIALKQLFRGSVSQTSVYPREVVKEALSVNAAAVILAHNHPSGSVEPAVPTGSSRRR